MSTCTAAEIAEKRRVALEKLNAKKAQLQTTTNSNSQATTKGIPPSTSSGEGSKAIGASAFISALKQSFPHLSRQRDSAGGARDAAHPYQRPKTPPVKFTETHCKKPTLALTPPKSLAPIFGNSVSCKVYMVSATRFEVAPSGFHGALIDVFKTIPSKAYDQNTRNWSFALKDYSVLKQKVAPMKGEVIFGAIPKSVLHLCQSPVKAIDRTCLSEIESTLAGKLMPFQQEGVCFGISQRGRLMICDEMGLGKTYQALAIADYYREKWPLLICSTASTRDSWCNYVRALLPSVPLGAVQVLSSNQQYIGECKILVTSYNMMERHAAKLMDRRFGVLIFDESHNLKNHKAKCTAVADRLAKVAKHVILCTGTPALSRPLELYSQLNMIDPAWMSFTEFTSRYCDAKQTHFGWDASGQSNLPELNVILKLKFMIRRTKADVLPEMVEKFRETVVLDPALITWSEDAKAEMDKLSATLFKCKGREREEMLLKFYAQTAEVKARAVCSYIKSLVKDKRKFIVFAHHRIMMDAISECLVKLKVKYVRIDGSTRNDFREEYVNQFQYDTECLVAVLSLRACNSGITLTAAELIIFAELDWNPSTLAQAESRAHRIGQEKPVTCRYLMASNTADDIIWNMLKNKQDVLNKAGLFCEDLQEALHTAAPIGSQQITDFFSPNNNKTANANEVEKPKEGSSPATSTAHFKKPESMAESSEKTESDVKRELNLLDDIFADVEDEVENKRRSLGIGENTQQILKNEFSSQDDFFPVDKKVEETAKDFFNDDDDDVFKNLNY